RTIVDVDGGTGQPERIVRRCGRVSMRFFGAVALEGTIEPFGGDAREGFHNHGGAAELDRALECHGAKEALGHTTAASDDPFWLPGSSVDIDVRSAKDGFDVAVSAYSSSDAHQVLARANAFAKSKTSIAPKAGEAVR
ncbi:MAG: hypothetical protein ACLP1X_24525, partial [Polyangiaceae bacterium]